MEKQLVYPAQLAVSPIGERARGTYDYDLEYNGAMPRFKVRGVLERDALADWWRHTLNKIPTVFGRLVYMAALRDGRTGAYRHHGLTSTYGREEGKRALTESHQQLFGEWLSLPLPEKVSELRSYLVECDEDAASVIRYWRHSGHSRSQFPLSATHAQREQFVEELDLLLGLLQGEFEDAVTTGPVGAERSPDSARPW